MLLLQRFSKFVQRKLQNWNIFISIKKLPFSFCLYIANCRSQRPRGLSCRTAGARLLRLWVRIPPGAWISICCECCVLSGRGLCNELITRPEESYRPWCVVVCDLETSWMGRSWPTGGGVGCCAKNRHYNLFWKNVQAFHQFCFNLDRPIS